MGMYDYIEYTCLNCKKKTESQTKLSSCFMTSYKIGEIFLEDNVNMNLILKDKCEKCKSQNCIIIKNGKIKGTISIKEATHEEGNWGSLNKLKEKNNG